MSYERLKEVSNGKNGMRALKCFDEGLFVIHVGLDNFDTSLCQCLCFAAVGIASQAPDLVGAILEGGVDEGEALSASGTNDGQQLGHVGDVGRGQDIEDREGLIDDAVYCLG